VDPVALGKALSDLGGLGLFLVAVVAATVGLHRRWWVPGWIDKEREAVVTRLRAENRELVRSNARLTEQLARERRRRRTDAPDA